MILACLNKAEVKVLREFDVPSTRREVEGRLGYTKSMILLATNLFTYSGLIEVVGIRENGKRGRSPQVYAKTKKCRRLEAEWFSTGPYTSADYVRNSVLDTTVEGIGFRRY